jgi:hypothetical protein
VPRIAGTSSAAGHASSPGTWLADLCAHEGLPCVLGQARPRKAIHGGTAKHDPIAAQNIAVLRRGGMLPQASGDPAARRATRDLRCRRRPRARTRGALLAPGQHTTSQDNLPALGTKLA